MFLFYFDRNYISTNNVTLFTFICMIGLFGYGISILNKDKKVSMCTY